MSFDYSKWDNLDDYDDLSDDSDDGITDSSRPKLPPGFLQSSNPHGKSTVITVPWEINSGLSPPAPCPCPCPCP